MGGFASPPSWLPPGPTTNHSKPCRNPPGCRRFTGTQAAPDRCQGCASGGGSISPLRRAWPGGNSPLPCHGALSERKSSRFNPFVFRAQVCHTFHFLLILFIALPLFPSFPLFSPLFSLFLYFKRGKELKEAAKRQQATCSTRSDIPGSS